MLRQLGRELAVSLRAIVRAPVLAITIVATVGLGIGATVAVFAAVDAAVLRPLPYPHSDRLVRIYTDAPPNRFPLSVADYMALTAQQTHFEGIAGYATRAMTFWNGKSAERVAGRAVTTTYFGLLGVRPEEGRDFTASDGRLDETPSAIVSNSFWRTHLSSTPVGRSIRLDGTEYTLVGILPPHPGPLERGIEVFVAAQWPPPSRKGPFFITVLGRLRPGVSAATAADELRAINRRIFPIWRSSFQDDRASWGLVDLKTHIVGDVGTLAALSLSAVGLVWLLASANASNLLLARIATRRRELSVRAALGASRARIIGHLLAESAWLASASAVVGFAIAYWATTLLRQLGAEYVPRAAEIAFDDRVLAVLGTVTLAGVILFGLVPALAGTRAANERSLRESGRWSAGGVNLGRLRRVLVGAQFAIATPLLVVAALLLASLNALGHVDLGFDEHHVLSGSLVLPMGTQTADGGVRIYWDELQRRISALPGVAGMAYATGRPPDEVNNFNNFDLEDAPTPPGSSQPVTPWIAVTPEYFRVLGLRLLAGRLLDDRDVSPTAAPAIVVDRAWASRFFPNRSPIGRRLRQGGCVACPLTTIVGEVTDVRYTGIDKPDAGTVFAPMPPQAGSRFAIVRTNTDPAKMLPVVTRAIREVDPRVPFTNAMTMDGQIDRALEGPRWTSMVAALFATIALALSLVGVYGIMAHHVAQRTRDVGIRLALGGTRASVLRLVVGEGMKVVAAGLCAGLIAAAVAVRLAETLFFGVSRDDPRAFAGVAALMVTAALLACLIPAARIVRLEPGIVLRDE